MQANKDGISSNALGTLRNKYSHERKVMNHRDCPAESSSTLKSTFAPNTDYDFLVELYERYSHQPIFLQAVKEMAISLKPLFDHPGNGQFYKKVFLIMAEPERVISFRVNWMDDKGNICHNRGWRIEFSSVLGPYKGGLRFHPTVDEGVLKSLGWEQIFKNALTGMPLGAGKGGSDFDPKGKSDAEIRRFCESFMIELYRYLHPSTDVPAGDIGVGGREIGYLYGQYKRLTNRHGGGVLTGKSILFGGSHLRPEATGFGLVYIAKIAIEKNGHTLSGKRCMVSGSGNVAQYASKKLLEMGAKVITMSDSNGCIFFENGLSEDDWKLIVEAKQVHRARLSSLPIGKYMPDKSPWNLSFTTFDYAFPCATQNEIDRDGAASLVKNGVQGLFEGANLPTTLEGQDILRKKQILYIPGKAANAGGVAVSGLEMSQNAQRLQWSEEEIDNRLHSIMTDIYDQIEAQSRNGSGGTLEDGATCAGFLKVAQAMKEMGWVY